MSPWNYPVLLTLEPLIDALAAGNTVILKPSAYAPHTSQILNQILKECYPPKYVTMITGGREENQALLNQRFDKIFFTGGKRLERSPSSCCRIPDSRHSGAWWEKPVHRGFHGENFSHRKTDRIRKIPQLRTDLRCPGLYPLRCFCSKPAASGTGKRNPPAVWQTASSKSGLWENHQRKHFHRLQNLIAADKLVCGGESDPSALRIAPTILKDVTWDDPVMGEEIFGPILPVLTYSDLNDAIQQVESHPHPLALYLFTEDPAAKKESPCQMPFWRRLHQRYHHPSCHQRHAVRWCRRKRHGMLSWKRRI